jgi:hypothetical protein
MKKNTNMTDIESNKSAQTAQAIHIIDTTEGYVAVSKGCNYKKCCILVVMYILCIDLLCCMGLIIYIMYTYLFTIQSWDIVSTNTTNTTLHITTMPTYQPTEMLNIPSYSPTYEIPQ